MSSFSHGCDEDTGLLPTLCQMKQQDHNQTNSVQGQLKAGNVFDTNKGNFVYFCTHEFAFGQELNGS